MMILTNNRIIISKAGEIPTGNTNPANETQSYMTLLPQLAPKQGEKNVHFIPMSEWNLQD